ncbi:MAG: tetratricopeptide repeat protein [Prevotella ruminicola]|jgi:signal transduction histidine kinase|uniref:Tetratricopeptide repeat protein n=1 Tax=Xylanibacter ruminicola TaxID=839 RepID=A0A928BUT8_XYLRU|nr:tetratricopeptide repeat protein [Xylanibacter ruminicola]
MKVKFLIICLFTVLSVGAYNDYRNARVDSLEAALKSKNPPEGADLLRAYDELMRGYLPFNGIKASYYGHKALALSYELNGLRVRQDVLRRFAQMHYAREEFDEAIRIFQQALAVVDSMEHDIRYTPSDVDDARSCLYGAIGNVYNMQDKAHLAIHYYQLALPIFEKYKWLESQTVLYHNVGELYFLMGNYQEAERNYLMGLSKSSESKDSLMIALSQKGLLRLYINMGDYPKAIKMAGPCYSYYHAHRTEEVGDYYVVLASMVRLNLMEGHKNITAAKTYAKEALKQVDELGFEDKSNVYAACSEVAMAEKQWQQALDYALQTIHPDSLATSADASCYKLLAEIYTELGQKAKAREYIQKMHDVMSRYSTDHYQSGLSQMKVLYETEKKEAQIAALDKERGLYRWLLVAAIIAIAALVAGGILMVLVQRRKKALLAAKVALDTETKERRILARDLHDSLGSMLSVLRLKIEGDTQKDETLRMIDQTATELRRISHHIMPEELLQGGLRTALADFAISVSGTQFHFFGNDTIRICQDMELVLYRCAYELVNNALKHAAAEHIDIQLMQEEEQISLTVSDDGKGMSNTPPSHEGMGFENIRARIGRFNGKLNIVSTENTGTEINITLPL